MNEDDKWLSIGAVWMIMLIASIAVWLGFFWLIGVL